MLGGWLAESEGRAVSCPGRPWSNHTTSFVRPRQPGPAGLQPAADISHCHTFLLFWEILFKWQPLERVSGGRGKPWDDLRSVQTSICRFIRQKYLFNVKKHVLPQLSPSGPSSRAAEPASSQGRVHNYRHGAAQRHLSVEISRKFLCPLPHESWSTPLFSPGPLAAFSHNTLAGPARAEFVLCLLCNKGAGASWAGPWQTLGRDGKYRHIKTSKRGKE